jgi:hypothetical protein
MGVISTSVVVEFTAAGPVREGTAMSERFEQDLIYDWIKRQWREDLDNLEAAYWAVPRDGPKHQIKFTSALLR